MSQLTKLFSPIKIGRMKAEHRPTITNWCSLALVFMTLMVAACTQQAEPHPSTPPTPTPNTTSTHSSNTSDAYDFPIKPGTDAWRAFNSHQEMLNACQIPESILQNMSTSGLVETVMNYPLLSDMLAFDNIQEGFNSVASSFNGLSTLLQRNDAGTVLLTKYRVMDPAAIPGNWTDLQKGEYAVYHKNLFYLR
jgi:hypothetical protein